jgi:hypothetical protein
LPARRAHAKINVHFVLPFTRERVVALCSGREEMMVRLALMGHRGRVRVGVFSLMFGLTCLAGGCGARPGSETASPETPVSAKSLKEHMKQRAAVQKAAIGKRQASNPAGR